MKKILIAIAGIAILGIGAAGATTAYFSDTEASAGNTFTAGGINARLVANPAFAATNMMPGDVKTGSVEFDAVGDDHYYACGAFETTGTNDSNDTDTDSEREAGDNDFGNNQGELQNFVELLPVDVNGDVVGQPIEMTDTSAKYFTIADSNTGNSDGLAAETNYTYDVKACFGNWVDTKPGNDNAGYECQVEFPTTDDDNVAMTDSVEGTVNILAIQTQNNDNFVCSDLNPTTVVTLTQNGNTYFDVDGPSAGANQGFNVGISASDMPNVDGVTSVKVQLFENNNLLVTNYVNTTNPGTAGVIGIVEAQSDLSSPFRNTLSGSTSWNYGTPVADWTMANKPTKAVITIEHNGGTWVGVLNGFSGNYHDVD